MSPMFCLMVVCSGRGYRHDSMCPLKWKCANECWLLTTGKIEVVSMYKGRSRGRVWVGGEGVGIGRGVGIGGEE